MLFQNIFYTYGIDWDGPPPLDLNNSSVVIPEINCPLSSSELVELHSLYNPLSSCSDFGINVYLDVLTFVENQLL